MSDWIDDTIQTPRDKHRKSFIDWVELSLKQGYNEDEIKLMFLEQFAGKSFFTVYMLWLQEYFDDMKEPA